MKQREAAWGDGFLLQMSRDLKAEFPEMKGFSRRNLEAMRQWYRFWSAESVIALQLVAQIPLGSSFNEDGVGVPMFQGNADFEFRFPKERIYTTEPTRFAQKFDTLISVRAPVGAQNMAYKECCIGRGVAAFRYKNNSDYYTYTYFKLRSLMREIQQFNDEGAVFGAISKSDFEAFITTLPPNKLVRKFEEQAKSINDKVIENCAQIRTLEKLCDNLLPKLMSGEVRVAL
jgi:type I restriction enzyme, S subunit